MHGLKLIGLGAALALLVLAARNGGQTGVAQACTVTLSPGQSIQSAIDQATSGAVICLSQGAWEENLTISKSLTLQGAGKDNKATWLTWVKGKEAGKPILRIKSGTRIEVIIEGLATVEAKPFSSNEFCAAKAPHWICPDGIQVWSLVQATIRNVRISSNPFVGLLLLDSAQVTITDTSISDNRFGIDMSSSAQAQITNSQIFGNGFYGIEILDTAKATISNTTIEGNGTRCSNYICNGITVFDRVQLEIRDSRVANNTAWGVAAVLIECGYSSNSFTGRVTLANNVIEGNRRGQVCLP